MILKIFIGIGPGASCIFHFAMEGKLTLPLLRLVIIPSRDMACDSAMHNLKFFRFSL